MQGITDKRVLVTGASSGIGQAIAVRFGQSGAHVAINYLQTRASGEETERRIRGYERCAQSVRRAGGRVALIKADVAQEADVRRMVATAIEELGGLDVLINNAGIQTSGASHALPSAEFDAVVSVNLRGAYLCAREVIAHLLQQAKPGVIVNISSVHERIPKPRYVGYAVSKGGMRTLTRTLALEYARHGIRVNAIGPGAIVTDINRAWVDDPDKRRLVENHIPLGRAGYADEIAAATVFLCSDAGAYITGQTLFVDGGLTLYPDFQTPWSSE